MSPIARRAFVLTVLVAAACKHATPGGAPVDSGSPPSADCGALPTVDGGTPLYVMHGAALQAATPGRKIAFESLQGVLNRSAPRVFLDVDTGDTHDADFLAYLVRTRSLTPVTLDDVDCYLTAFHAELAGYVLCDSSHPDSINAALSVAGVTHAVAVDAADTSLLALLRASGLTQLADASAADASWLPSSAYWSQLSRDEIMELSPVAGIEAGRDLAVAHGMAIFYDDSPRDPQLQVLARLLADQKPGGRAYGWGFVDNKTFYEESFVEPATQANLGWVATDQARNLSVYGGFALRGPLSPPPPPPLPTDTAVHYVTFVYSDGDNLGAIQNLFSIPKENRYGSPDRGKVAIGWTIPPSLATLAPPLAEWLYESATPDDAFVAGPSSWAYLYPSVVPDKSLLTQRVDASFTVAKLSSFVSLDFGADGFNKAALDPMTAPAVVAGGFYSALRGGDPATGSIVWSNGKPVVAMAHIGFTASAASQVDAVASALSSAPRDATAATGYTAIYASLWGTSVEDLVSLATKAGPGVVVVRPDTFLALITRNVPH